MRPLRLDMAGFTVFREPTTVDFSDADFWALVGPTGSGKSTVLDAICFALYGTVPRWADRRGVASALAPSANEARVRLIFESAGARYAATRVVRRDGKGRVATSHAGLEELPRGFDLSTLDAADPGDPANGAASRSRGGGRGGTITRTGPGIRPGGEGSAESRLGSVLAGSPAEMDDAVVEVVGLPYEQFTRCVVLPQGEFAEFLHAKPAARQQILVNLLGLSVYQEIRTLATTRAAQADAQLVATDRQITELADATAEAIADADRRVDAMRALASEVDRVVPQLREAHRTARRARTALADLDAALGRLDAVRVPAATTDLAATAARAASAVVNAAEAVTSAEEHEEKLRVEWAGGPDPARLRAILDAHAELDSLGTDAVALAGQTARAEQAHAAAQADLAAASGRAVQAAEAVVAAQQQVEDARSANRAEALRAHLRPGDACPVCEQTVETVPPSIQPPEMQISLAALDRARKAAEAATAELNRRERVARDRDVAAARLRDRHDQLDARIEDLRGRLADAPGPQAARERLDRSEQVRAQLDDAAGAVRRAREEQRRATAAVQQAQQRMRAAWREFDTVRDAAALAAAPGDGSTGDASAGDGSTGDGSTSDGSTGDASDGDTISGGPAGPDGHEAGPPPVDRDGRRAGPPPVDRDDLAGAWQALAAWAAAEADARRQARTERSAAVRSAEAAAGEVASRLQLLFSDAGIAPPDASAELDRYGRLAFESLMRAESTHARLVERREQAEKVREQRATHERDGQVARALANHLRSNNFERWLLAEALDQLVEGASRILRELSGGQYDLVHAKGEFSVVDHYDAALRRPVRTLSGGETFQASLALALALSEQLGGMSTAAASLESIVLDEGFGTLDGTTLDTVAATLEDLAARGDRMVGLVTHVVSLAERVPVRFEVRKDGRGARVERVAT